MSEYQYYEFQAIDRPLTKDEMAELRALSTRATISPTRFMNVYHWGNFKGDPLVLMERYFDAFVYVANWGTHHFMLRLPRSLLTPETAERYCVEEDAEAYAQMHIKGDYVILEFMSQDDQGGGWVTDEEAEAWLPALIPLRADIASGDLRTLYLGWLLCANGELLADDAVEPPVPPGLGKLSAALQAFSAFLRIDDDLLAVAAERSAALPEARPASPDFEPWIRALPEAEKDALLGRVVEGDPHVRTELLRRFRQAHQPRATASLGRRTVAQLLAAAEEHAAVRRRKEAERAAHERARREREEAAARAAHLDSLAGREEAIWRQVEALVETKRAASYDQAVQLLTDLRDLSLRSQARSLPEQPPPDFDTRLCQLRARHATKVAFLSRLDRAHLAR